MLDHVYKYIDYRFVIGGKDYPLNSNHFMDRYEDEDGEIVCKTSITILDID